MYTKVKTDEEIAAMRESGRMLATVLQLLRKSAVSGMSTKDLARLAEKELKSLGGKPSFLGFEGFTDVLCVSINDEVVHGIPSDKRILKEGDIISTDFGVTYKGMITDASITFALGEVPFEVEELIKVTEQSLFAGIDVVKAGVRVGDIASAIQKVLERHKYGIVRDLVGHGVGHELHEDPNLPNYGHAGSGPVLNKGMTVALEPMATLGTHEVWLDRDGWTVHTADGSLSAHFEHTILITERGSEILTAL
jgi:methionyl aminopeptidase